MLNWIVWNRTDYLHKMDLALNNLQRLMRHKTQPNKTNQTKPSPAARMKEVFGPQGRLCWKIIFIWFVCWFVCLFVCLFVLWHINLCRLFNAKSIFIQIISISTPFYCQKIFLFQAIQFSQTVLIQTIQLSIGIVFIYTQLNVKTVLLQTIQFSISTQFSSIWPINRALSGVTTPGQSRPETMAIKWYSPFPQAPELPKPYHQIV